jgi:transporter family-2 protein
MIGFFIAIISGALMSIQGVFNTQVTKTAGVWASSAFVQFSALLVCLGTWAIWERGSLTKVFHVEPKYMLLGGVIGAFITYTVIQSMSSLGPARAAMLIVISQLITAYLIEVFGIFGMERTGFSFRKVIGMGIAILGILIFKWE